MGLRELPSGEVGERTRLIHQFGVGSALNQFAVLQHKNAVCIDNGAQTMGNNDAGSLHRVQTLRDGSLRLVVHGARCFIKKDYTRPVH